MKQGGELFLLLHTFPVGNVRTRGLECGSDDMRARKDVRRRIYPYKEEEEDGPCGARVVPAPVFKPSLTGNLPQGMLDAVKYETCHHILASMKLSPP